MFRVSKKIVVTRQSLQHWQRSTFGHRSRTIHSTRNQLQNLLSLPPSPADEETRKDLASKLNSLLSQDNEYWKQRSKVLWLAQGHRNTQFFHKKASSRRLHNLIKALFDLNGDWQDSDIEIGFTNHWVQLIMQCVITVRYSFLVNGEHRGYLSPTRGLRRGDPL